MTIDYDEWTEIGEPAGISNAFGPSVDPGIEDLLRQGGCWTRYAGWNFNGRIWFADNRFYCDVWTYGVSREVLTAPTLPDLIEKVCDQYGYE